MLEVGLQQYIFPRYDTYPDTGDCTDHPDINLRRL